MIANLIGGFVSILVGVSLVGPVSTQVTSAASATNSSGGACVAAVAGSATESGCQLYLASSWGATVLKLVPGFFSLGILGIGLAVTYTSLRESGVI
jgi:hypothetical protein